MSEEQDSTQLSVENILSDVYARRKSSKTQPKIDIQDIDELRELQGRKRKEFESYLKRNRLDMRQWLRYASFELEQHDMRRARSVFERALLVNGAHIPLWIRYIDSEIKYKYLNHARNILDRAITTLPRADKLWYKYLFLEESLENWEIVRSLFNKWCSLEPERGAWISYINFEIRQQKYDNVRDIYEKFVLVYPEAETWLEWVKFESIYGSVESIRNIYSMALDTLILYESTMTQSEHYEQGITKLALSFAQWEISEREYERAATIYKISRDKWPNDPTVIKSQDEYNKSFGSVSDINDTLIAKRKINYENELENDVLNYYSWMLYIDLIQKYYSKDIINVFERAVTTSIPNQKRVKNAQWRRYIYLWIRYFTFMELDKNDVEGCRILYKRCLNKIVPHSAFTFSKIWIMYSEFEIRQNNLPLARRILGRAIGMCPTKKLFKNYIKLELKLREFDRVRKLYEKYIEYTPSEKNVWLEYSKLEENLGDEERARGIFKLSVQDNVTDMPIVSQLSILDKFIEFETEAQEYDNARSLYETYLRKGNYAPKIWISYAMYESSVPTATQLIELYGNNDSDSEESSDEDDVEFKPTEENFDRARKIYERGLEYFKEREDGKNRFILFQSYEEFEEKFGTIETKKQLTEKAPKAVLRVRHQNGIQKEYTDYVFPDDSSTAGKINVSRFLSFAKKWKEEEEKEGDTQ
ncbi:similar to Saccharomyces cerevisiae YLR117C CLF1 Member of the NineTeen Complex (NTC) that contains Prp19p and stabilizes U6 snRNA in catalytic forms of the spliceosome containing U2 [Maudiozyma saulgeensis]|uniref:Pre-mRNA-splicing factor CLF1 n=1 Tax=Maudiozyma saulgeensis TaxID=1789683 RepID=A0A1X7R7I7_9SACH|nr:similar to Saccharomyces cerevisiae YLR117C CLF1 Member of the NineTeen Complex (NTC) that contains Prp19p and stabilizes U6 snRNA in catalytic forms of the spliceosome containing U2 [Kazachstania saulgeensis]